METKDRIIQCALRELERAGLEGFSIRATGAAAGLSAMAIYRHFADRDALLRAVGADAFEAFFQRVTSIGARSLARWMAGLTRVYVDFALDEPGRFDACFVLRLQAHRVYPDDFRAGKSPVIAMMTERIRQENTQGNEDPLETALLIWAQLHGLIMLHRAGRFALPRPAFVALCIRATTRLLPAPHPRTKRKTK